MQSVPWGFLESETPQLQTTEAGRSAASVPEKQTSRDKEPSDRQAAESMYASFVWLFGSGCY
jgi:hypothetical protein